MSARPPATPGRPLYFWHIPKTAGSSLIRLLGDRFQHGDFCHQPFPTDFDPVALRGRSAFAGHLGDLPLRALDPPPATFTVLRHPADRAWSHWRFTRWKPESRWVLGGGSQRFDELFDGPDRWLVADFQARWLAGCPFPHPIGRSGPIPPADADVAAAVLEAMDVVGTVERLPEAIDALSRSIGRRLAAASVVNANPELEVMPGAARRRVERASPVDLRLWRRADERLDELLTTLPPLPAPRLAPLPWRSTMDDGIIGTGWHGRVDGGGDTGWHRWSGPGTRSTIEADVRLGGPARLRIHVVSAVADAVVAGLVVEVQGAQVVHRLVPTPAGEPGVLVEADVELDPGRPLEVALTVPWTAPLEAGAAAEPAGVAVGSVALVTPPGGRALPRAPW